MENANFSSSNCPNSRWKSGADLYMYGGTTSVALLLTGLCIGLPGLIGVLISFYRKRSEARELTVFNVSLIFTALLQSLSTPVMAILLINGMCRLEHCDKFVVVWYASRHCGVLLHLLVVLEFTVANPRYRSKPQSVYYSLPIVLTLVVVCMLFSEVTYASNIGLGALASALAVVACTTAVWSWCTRHSPMEKSEVQVIVLAIVTLITYAPSFVLMCMAQSGIPVSGRVYNIMLFLTNMRLVTDAHLCWLVTRESRAPPQQDHALILENMAVGRRIRTTGHISDVPGPSLGGAVRVPTAPNWQAPLREAGGGGWPYVGAPNWQNRQQQEATGDPPNYFGLAPDN